MAIVDPDQSAHQCSLIRVLVVCYIIRLCIILSGFIAQLVSSLTADPGIVSQNPAQPHNFHGD